MAHSLSLGPAQRHAKSILDVYADHAEFEEYLQSSDQVIDHSELYSSVSSSQRCCVRLCRFLLVFLRHRLRGVVLPWVFLMILGVACALYGSLVETVAKALLKLRVDWIVPMGWVGILPWIVWAGTLAVASSFVCGRFARDAEGSGIPEVRTILSGTALTRYLSVRVGIVKFLSVVLTLASGLSAGKEGPFVHMAGTLAHFLTSLPPFRFIRERPAVYRQMLAAAVAAGVTAVFGTPIGGVLFSIEVTATHYRVANMWRAFACAVCCVYTFAVLQKLQNQELFTDTSFNPFSLNWEVVAFAMLGAICGIVGSLFVYTTAFVVSMRQRQKWLSHHRYVLVAGVAAATGLVTYGIPFLTVSDRDVINDMFGVSALDEKWTKASVPVSLLGYIVLKFCMTLLAITLPLSSGMFTPVFSLGAALGRAVGELMALVITTQPGAYALVGAAALTSSVTHTLSTAVMVFEVTGQLQHLLPVLIGVIAAYTVSVTFTLSIYDVLLYLKGLPNLAAVKPSALYRRTAQDLMTQSIGFLTLRATYGDAEALLHKHPAPAPHEDVDLLEDPVPTEFPVVENEENMLLVGSVQRRHLERAVNERWYAFLRAESGTGDSAAVGPDQAAAKRAARLGGRHVPHAHARAGSAGSVGSAGSIGNNGERRPGDRAGSPHAGHPPGYHQVSSVSPGSSPPMPSSALHTATAQAQAEPQVALHACTSSHSLLPHEHEGVAQTDPATRFMMAHLEFNAPVDSGIGHHPAPSSSPPLPNDESSPPSTVHAVSLDPAPFTLAHLTPLSKVHYLFTVGLHSQAMVTRHGRLVGVLFKTAITRMGTLQSMAQAEVGSGRRQSQDGMELKAPNQDSTRHRLSGTRHTAAAAATIAASVAASSDLAVAAARGETTLAPNGDDSGVTQPDTVHLV